MPGIDEIWDRLGELIYRSVGLDISKYRRNIFQRRLETWGQRHNCSTLYELYEYLVKNPEQIQEVINYATVDISSFFRNREVFECVGQYIRDNFTGRTLIRIGSFGCGRGQEAYTMAMVLWKYLGKNASWMVYALDIDRKNVSQGKLGVYTQFELKGMTNDEIDTFFTEQSGEWKVLENLRTHVTWVQANLFTLPFKESIFDVVLCRNLSIFMVPSAHEELFREISRVLRKDALLVLGMVERVPPKWRAFYPHVSRTLHIFRYSPQDMYGG